MSASRIVKRFMLIRIVTISGLLFLAGVVALLFFAKMEEQVVAYGRIEPQDAAEIRGKRTTTISAVLVEPGQVVAKGDMLFKTSSTRVRNELDRAKDRLEKAKASLTVQLAQLTRLVKNPLPEKLRFADEDLSYAKSAMDLSLRELARTQKLAKDGLMAQAQVDVVLARHEANVNRYRLAVRKHQLVQAGLEEATVTRPARVCRQIHRHRLERSVRFV